MTNENPAWQDVLKMHSVADIQAAAAKDKFWPTALAAFAIAASPDAKAALKADLPYREENGQVIENTDVVRRWRHSMPLDLASERLTELQHASGIAIDYGYEDEFSHIPLTARELGEKLLQGRVPVTLEGYHGDHNNGVPARVGTRMIPFVAERLHF
jgi:hypothetical protein